MPETGSTARQWELIRRWLADLKEIPALDVVWLEGSLANGRGTPYSDIDIRFAIADEEYEQLWSGPAEQENDAWDPLEARGPTRLLAGLGEYLLLETAFVRALTSDGLLVEAGAVPTSQTDGLVLYEWEILFSRLPAGAPAFRRAPKLPPDQVWPETEALTPASVWQRAKMLLLMMLHTPDDAAHAGRLPQRRTALGSVYTRPCPQRSAQADVAADGLALRQASKTHVGDLPGELADLAERHLPAISNRSAYSGRPFVEDLCSAGRAPSRTGCRGRRRVPGQLVRAALCLADT